MWTILATSLSYGQIPYLRRVDHRFYRQGDEGTSRGAGFQETCYIASKDTTGGLLRSSNYRKVCSEQRPYRALDCDRLPSAAASFWERCDVSRGLNARPVATCSGCTTEVGGLRVRRWSVDRSTPGYVPGSRVLSFSGGRQAPT